MPHVHNTRSQANRCQTEDETEDELDYQSMSDETEVGETTIVEAEVSHGQPLMNTMAQMILQMQKDQRRRDEEHHMQLQEQARRDEEHRTQMQILTETLARMQAGDAVRETSRARTKAKKVHHPVLGPMQDVTMADFRTWREGYEGYVQVTKLDTECDLIGRRTMIRSAIDTTWQKLWSSGVLSIDADDDIRDIMDKMYRYLRSQPYISTGLRLGGRVNLVG